MLKHNSPNLLRAGVTLLTLLITSKAVAATYQVASVDALRTAISNAVAGDTIIVQNGVYPTTAAINVNRVGTAAAPITIAAESVGGVEFTGTHGISLTSPAAHIVVDGFVFSHTSGRIHMPVGTQHCRYTRNIFQCTGSGNYITIGGDDHEVDRNEFRNKSTVGNMIDVRGAGSQIARRLWIHHNYFHDFTNAGANGAETLRFGLSGLSLSDGDGLVEHNLFVRCVGENEIISIKASSITVRYNTILDSPGTQLTQRHGNDCLIYGNYLRGTDGIRIFGDRHQIFSNYLENNTGGLNIGNGGGEVADGDPLTSHDRPDDCVITFNTLINNSRNYYMTGRTNGLGATNITFANNIIQGGGNAASLSTTGPYTGTWSGNILWNVPAAGDMPASGYTIVNPLLAPDENGVFHLQPGSPAIDAAIGTYPAVTVDMDGQLRDANKDVGADEFSGAPIIAKLLTPADVGTGVFVPEPEPPAPPLEFEAETLEYFPVNGSASVSFEDSPSGGTFASPNISDPTDPRYDQRRRYVTFGADGNPPPPDGEYIDFILPDVPAGTYNFVLRYKTHPNNRGVLRLALDGVTLGGDLDLRSKAIFTTHDFGVVRFNEDGDHIVRLTVVGKTNATTTPWNLTADVFQLFPDSNKPVITTPLPDLTVEATGPTGAVVEYSASATDKEDGAVPVIFEPASGSVFPLGTTVVVATAQDAAGNIAVVSFEVTVVDSTPPEIQNLTASPDTLWPPNGKMIPVTVSASVVDTVDPSPSVRIISVTSDEPPAPGQTDWEITGDLTLNLRAKRAGEGDGRVYTITFEARDAAGNASTATVEVLVPHDQGNN